MLLRVHTHLVLASINDLSNQVADNAEKRRLQSRREDGTWHGTDNLIKQGNERKKKKNRKLNRRTFNDSLYFIHGGLGYGEIETYMWNLGRRKSENDPLLHVVPTLLFARQLGRCQQLLQQDYRQLY